ncbi:MAG: hypothetical protein U9Q67_02995 [Patescibacteria group bacterium]|nr:hypothetical protein [Patescibacteria group bacterium]
MVRCLVSGSEFSVVESSWKAAMQTLSNCVFCSGNDGGFTFAHLSVRLPGNFTSIEHFAQASFGGNMADDSEGLRGEGGGNLASVEQG